MYLRCVGKSIIVPQTLEVTLCVPHMYQQTQMYSIYSTHVNTRTHTCTHTDTLEWSGIISGLIQTVWTVLSVDIEIVGVHFVFM